MAVAAIPAGAPFSKYIDDNILTPLVSRLDFMLMGDQSGAPEPDGSTDTAFNHIAARMGNRQELCRRIRKDELGLVDFFNQVEQYVDKIFESSLSRPSGDAERPQYSDGILHKLHILRKQVADTRDAIRDPDKNKDQESAGGEDPAVTVKAATGQVGASIPDGKVMTHLRRAIDGIGEQLRSCLLSLAAFPEDAVVKKRMLIHWWIGDELVADAGEGKRCFKRLVDMKFVRAIHRPHCETVHWCTVHPWIHSMIVAVASSSAFMEVDPDGDSSSNANDFQGTRRACLRNGKAMAPGCRLGFHPKVWSIYNIDQMYVKLSAEWFPKKTPLRTLQLGQWQMIDESKKADSLKKEKKESKKADDADKFHVELIHHEHLSGIAACQKLRYLSLRGISRINAIPDGVGDLSELIVLDLRACYNLQALTKRVTKLRKLQYLDVSECYLLVEMPKGIGNISELQVLKGFVVASSGRKNACRLGDLAELKNMRKLSVCIGNKVMKEGQDELKKLASLVNLKSLRITWGVMSLMSSKDGETPTPNTEDMKFSKFSLPPDLVKLDLQCFPCEEFEHLITEDGLSVLKKLQKLYLIGGALKSLKPLCASEAFAVKFLRLRFLKKFLDDGLEELRSLLAKFNDNLKVTWATRSCAEQLIKDEDMVTKICVQREVHEIV